MPEKKPFNKKDYVADGEFFVAKDGRHLFYRGIKFNWLEGYYRRYTFSKGIPSNLQRTVWIDHFGEIPPGHHIHHKDRNTRNNHIENLQCLEGRLHLSRSAKSSSWVGSPKNLSVLTAARAKAKPWHSTKEGLAFHRKQAKSQKLWLQLITFQRTCQQCGKDYQSGRRQGMFCSRTCKSNFRYHSQVDTENRICLICDKYFVMNRYSKTKTCGLSCKTALFKISRTRK